MTRRQLLAAVAATESLQPFLSAAASRPNILWVWADNLAYQDLACYGNPRVKTPYLDQLAQSGVRFTQYYVAHVVCSPSRAGFLTGRQPFRSGVVDVFRPDSPSGLPPDEITLASALRKLGYATCAIGKWHLGDRQPFLPLQHGFDQYFGMPCSMDMAPTMLMRGNQLIDNLEGDKVDNITQRYVDEAVLFLKGRRSKPFFLYFSHTLPHPPINLPASARTSNRPIYDDAIEHLDAQTGRLLATIDQLGIGANTLVIFSSDNGPMAAGGSAGKLRGRIRDAYEGGIRVPLMARWPGRIPAGRTVDQPAIAYDFFPTLLRLAGGALPKDRTYDGIDIWPLLEGSGGVERRDPFFWVYFDNVTTIRDGKWKLHVATRETRLSQPELYDIDADPEESRNLATQQPELVQSLSGKIEAFQKTVPKVWPLQYPVRDPMKLPSGIRRK